MLATATVFPRGSISTALPPAMATALTRKLEDGTLDLPVLADSAQRIMHMALDENVDPGVLADTIKRDGAMATHLLRIANSSLYRGRATIVSLQQATARLGMRKVREIALAIVCESRVFRVRGFDEEVRSVFRHSLAAAYIAAEIARVKRSNVEEAFLAALLHDIGRPVLLQAVVDLERELACRAAPGAALATADAHHASTGAALVARWELPPRVAYAVHRHHVDPEAGVAPLQAIVVLSDCIAHVALEGREAPAADLAASPAVAALNVYPDELAALLATTDKIRGLVEATR